MTVDFSRLPTGQAGWCALVAHAVELGDLAEVDYLELKGRMPFEPRSERKRSAVVLSRAILGLSNRDPEAAAKYLGGHGVVLVGVQRGGVNGTDPVDGAVLHDALEPYLGNDGPRWDFTYIDHPAGLVLAVIVDPPQWGDRMFTCRKEYAAEDGSVAVRDGDIFVRVPGKTRPATSAEIGMLERRRDRSSRVPAQVSVSYAGGFDRVNTSSIVAVIEQTIGGVERSLLEGVPSERSPYPYGGAASVLHAMGEGRSSTGFRREVAKWRQEAAAGTRVIVEEFYRHELARGQWAVTNQADRYLESVRVEMQFPAGVAVLAQSDTEYCDHGGQFSFRSLLPATPRKWGQGYAFDVPALTAGRLAPLRTTAVEFDVERTPDGARVVWHAGDLRPRSTIQGTELFAIVTDEHLEELAVQWQLTARGVDHVFDGSLTLTCMQEPGVHRSWTMTPGASAG